MVKVLVVLIASVAVAKSWWRALRSIVALFREEERRHYRGPIRARPIDYLAMFVTLLPVLLWLAAYNRIAMVQVSSLFCMGTPLLLTSLAMWWHGVRMLSVLEIHSAPHRALFLAVLLPIILASCPMGTVTLLLFVASLFASDPPLLGWSVVWLFVAAVGSFLAWGIRYVQLGTNLNPQPPAVESDG